MIKIGISEEEEGKIKKPTEKPLIGFFPCFYSMGETIPVVKIAKSYMNLGGRAVFFSHGGKYDYLAKKIGCRVIMLKPKLCEFLEDGINVSKNKATFLKNVINQYTETTIEKAVEEEIDAFTKSEIELIVSSFNLTCSISSKALKIPHVVVASGTLIPPYYKSGFATFPDNSGNPLINFVPQLLTGRIIGWYLLKNKMLVKEFNKVAKKYQIIPFRYFIDIFLGDIAFVCDNINFLGIKPTEEFPLENYIGPIFPGDLFKEQKKKIDPDIENHLKHPGKSIVVVMGSSGVKKIFLKIVEALNQTDYTVLAVYTNLLKKNELPKTNENILFKEFVPLDKIINKVDLAITHGGRGTVHTLAYSGKPAICIPIILEHQYNVDNLVRNGSAIRLSRKYFKTEELMLSISKIFRNYDNYQKNAQDLAKKMPKEDGSVKAAKRLFEICQSSQ